MMHSSAASSSFGRLRPLAHRGPTRFTIRCDALNRLESFQRGMLGIGNTSIVGTPSASETWGFDTFGNWNVITVNGTGSATNTTNSQNELTSVKSEHFSQLDREKCIAMAFLKCYPV
jgi:hypothetical protein